jgi:hypothetical protein
VALYIFGFLINDSCHWRCCGYLLLLLTGATAAAGQWLYRGSALDFADKLCSVGQGGQILMCGQTYQLVCKRSVPTKCATGVLAAVQCICCTTVQIHNSGHAAYQCPHSVRGTQEGCADITTTRGAYQEWGGTSQRCRCCQAATVLRGCCAGFTSCRPQFRNRAAPWPPFQGSMTCSQWASGLLMPDLHSLHVYCTYTCSDAKMQ